MTGGEPNEGPARFAVHTFVGNAVAGFGLSLSEAWSITVPDYLMIARAHRAIHSPAEVEPAEVSNFTPEEVAEHRRLMEEYERGDQKWRLVSKNSSSESRQTQRH